MFLTMYTYCHEENNHGKAGTKFHFYSKTPAEGFKKLKVMLKDKLTATDKLELKPGSNPDDKKWRVHKNGEPTGYQIGKVPPMFKLAGHDADFYSGDPQEVKEFAERIAIREAELASAPAPKLKWKKGELFDNDVPTNLSVKKVW